eukprot:1933389-Rhodomonas_salina.2
MRNLHTAVFLFAFDFGRRKRSLPAPSRLLPKACPHPKVKYNAKSNTKDHVLTSCPTTCSISPAHSKHVGIDNTQSHP